MSRNRHDFPQFKILPPPPSAHYRRSPVALADLPTGRYVDTIARVTSFRVKEVEDELGSKPVSSGVLEDSTFQAPFVARKIGLPLEKNLILRINSAYVHETRNKLLGRTVEARGNVTQLKDHFYFFPHRVMGMN